MKWTKIRVPLPASSAEEVSAILMEMGANGVQEIWRNLPTFPPLVTHLSLDQIKEGVGTEDVLLEAYFPQLKSKQFQDIQSRLRTIQPLFPEWKTFSLHREGVKEEDWLAKWKADFHALQVGKKLTISPSWEKEGGSKNRVVIVLDPGMAFGTGHHPTTAACLEFLEKIISEQHPSRLFDVGTGSGILAIAAAKLGVPNIVATDVDQESLRVSRKNSRQNRVSNQITFSHSSLKKFSSTFSVVVANILENVLVSMAEDLCRLVEPRGSLILSGILDSQKDELLNRVLKNKSFKLRDEKSDQGWTTLLLERKG